LSGSVGTGVGRRLGIGGSVGMIEVGVGTGVGEAVGAAVGAVVFTGGAVGAAVGGVVGADVGRTVGVDVRRSSVLVGGIDPAGAAVATESAGPASGILDGDAVAPFGTIGSAPTASRVRLNPTSARPTARDGPRRTYSVKDARPRWPRARSLDFPCAPTLVWYFLPGPNA
jgi:hypothetical protein